MFRVFFSVVLVVSLVWGGLLGRKHQLTKDRQYVGLCVVFGRGGRHGPRQVVLQTSTRSLTALRGSQVHCFI